MPKLILRRKARTLEEFELDGSKTSYTIGSAPSNDFVIRDKKVATKHLRIEQRNGNYYLEDLKSAFGTMLNGRPLFSRVQIVHGDDIALGDLSLFFDHQFSRYRLESFGNKDSKVDEDYLPKTLNPNHAAHHSPSAMTSRSEPDRGRLNASSAPQEFYEVEELSEEPKTQSLESQRADFRNSMTNRSYDLVAVYGPYMGKKYALKLGDNRIGRDNTLNDIVIRNNEHGVLDPSISRRHATISYRNGRFLVTDKRSKTRTYVNQTKLSPVDEVPVEEGDEIEIVSDQRSTIFRLLAAANHDLSPPKRAGIWWTRNSLRLGTILSVLFGIIAFCSFALSGMQQMALQKKPDQLKFIEEAWYQNRRSETQDSRQISSLAITDLTGDNSVDVIYSDPSGKLVALDGTTKRPIWQIEEIHVLDKASIVLSDLNANGLSDILVVGQDSRLRALDGSSGAEMWLSPILGDGISGPPVVADLNGDGLKDILICTLAGQIHLGHSYINDMDWTTLETGLTISSIPSSIDLDGDGNNETLVGTNEGKLLIINGGSGKVAAVFDFNEEISKATSRPYTEHQISYPVSCIDLNDNQVPDLVIGATDGNYLAIEGNTLSRIWHEKLPGELNSFVGRLASSVGQVGETPLEAAVIVSSQMIRIVPGLGDSKNRNQILWQYSISEDSFSTPLSLADFNKDGSNDIVIGTTDGMIHLLNGRDGKILSQIKQKDNAVISPLLLADLGGDGNLDILYMRQDRNIYKIQTNSPITKNSVVWGQTYSNAQHTGKYQYQRPTSTPYYIITAASGLLFFGISVLTISANRKRKRIIRKNQNS